MNPVPPALIAIDHDEYSAKYVGKTKDSRQFFVTAPFVPAIHGNPGREFLAVYLFDSAGQFLEARIDDLGVRSAAQTEEFEVALRQRINDLGPVTYDRIEIRPFQLTRYGTLFGLVPREPEAGDDSWWVEAQPGNYMAFHEPWDSGEYDT